MIKMQSKPEILNTHEVTFEADTYAEKCRFSARGQTAILSQGAAERDHPDKHRSELTRSSDAASKVQVYPTLHDALAAFLGGIQKNLLVTEDEAYECLKANGIDVVQYERWRGSFSRKDRVKRLINDSKERISRFGSVIDIPIIQGRIPFQDIDYNPELRSTDPSTASVNQVREATNKTVDTSNCYRQTQELLEGLSHDRVQYCEGLAMGKHPGRASTHAWIEIDGEVLEPTWLWDGIRPSEESVYYGDSLPIDHVIELSHRRPVPHSTLLPEDIYWELPRLKQRKAAGLKDTR